jgi:hypothetical protein
MSFEDPDWDTALDGRGDTDSVWDTGGIGNGMQPSYEDICDLGDFKSYRQKGILPKQIQSNYCRDICLS